MSPSSASTTKLVFALAILLTLSLAGLNAQEQTSAAAPQSRPIAAPSGAGNPLRAAIAREMVRLTTSAPSALADHDRVLSVAERALQTPTAPGSGPVRITPASVVDLPGVMRMDAAGRKESATGSELSSGAGLITVKAADGRVVTLPQPGRRVIGTITAVDEQTVTITQDHGPVVTIPRAAIARLERSNGRRSGLRWALAGLSLGAGAGAGLGFVTMERSGHRCPNFFGPEDAKPDYSCGPFLEDLKPYIGAVLGGGIGALAGALVGSERWREVPVTSLITP